MALRRRKKKKVSRSRRSEKCTLANCSPNFLRGGTRTSSPVTRYLSVFLRCPNHSNLGTCPLFLQSRALKFLWHGQRKMKATPLSPSTRVLFSPCFGHLCPNKIPHFSPFPIWPESITECQKTTIFRKQRRSLKMGRSAWSNAVKSKPLKVENTTKR